MYSIRTMIAVIQTGGKQYLVKEGDTVRIEKVAVEPGASFAVETLLIADEQGDAFEVGTPVLSTKTQVEVLEQGRADKISVVKYKAKSKYRRRVGHRQSFTKIKITKLAG